MNTSRAIPFVGLSTALQFVAATVIVQEQAFAQTINPPSATSQVPVYIPPPLGGAPTSRVSGGSRGTENSGLSLIVLAPENTGLTSRAQPTLYWYSSKGLSTPLEFTLNDERSVKPLVELKVTALRLGIHTFRLNYNLKPDVEYQWSIAAVADPNQRASDIIASGTLRRVQPSAALTGQLNRASKRELPFLYAREGLWYDAFATLSEQIDDNPTDRGLQDQRAALLEQVKLTIRGCSDLKKDCSLEDTLGMMKSQ